MLAPRMQNAEHNVIADVAMVDVRRIVGVKRFGRRHVSLRRLAVRPQPIVGGEIDHHRRIGDSPRAQEELFELACGALLHRPDADSVCPYLRANGRHAIVDREEIARSLQGKPDAAVGIGRIRDLAVRGQWTELREGLCGQRVIVIMDCKFAEWLKAIGISRIGQKRRRRIVGVEASGVGACNDGRQIAVNDFVPLEHGKNRFALCVPGLVVQQRMQVSRFQQTVLAYRIAGEVRLRNVNRAGKPATADGPYAVGFYRS